MGEELYVRLTEDLHPYFKAGDHVEIDPESLEDDNDFLTTFDGTAYIPLSIVETDENDEIVVLGRDAAEEQDPVVAGKKSSTTKANPQVTPKAATVDVKKTEAEKKDGGFSWLTIVGMAAASIAFII